MSVKSSEYKRSDTGSVFLPTCKEQDVRTNLKEFTKCKARDKFSTEQTFVPCEIFHFSLKGVWKNVWNRLFQEGSSCVKHRQRHNGPEGWVHITRSQFTVHKLRCTSLNIQIAATESTSLSNNPMIPTNYLIYSLVLVFCYKNYWE